LVELAISSSCLDVGGLRFNGSTYLIWKTTDELQQRTTKLPNCRLTTLLDFLTISTQFSMKVREIVCSSNRLFISLLSPCWDAVDVATVHKP